MDSVPAVGVLVWTISFSLSAPANRSGLTLQKKIRNSDAYIKSGITKQWKQAETLM
jgi:hypothetical protein